jgi:hypothetical protein
MPVIWQKTFCVRKKGQPAQKEGGKTDHDDKGVTPEEASVNIGDRPHSKGTDSRGNVRLARECPGREVI